MSSSYLIQQLLEKCRNGDPDFRYMALLDANSKIIEPTFLIDDATENQLVEQVLNMFSDNNSEVKSVAAKTISILVGKVKEDRVRTIIEKLTSMTSGKDDVRDIASLALKTVVQEISPDSKLANTACDKLAPKILLQLRNTTSSQDVLIQLIEVLGDVYARFGTTIRNLPSAQTNGLAGLTLLLNDPRGAIRKRVIRAIGNLIACSGESVFKGLIDKDIIPGLQGGSAEQLKTTIALCGTLAMAAPKRTGKKLREILPQVLQATEADDEDLKETSLQAIEMFLLKCPTETAWSMTQIIDAATKLTKYDPNYAAADDDVMDEDAEDEVNGEDSDEEDAEYAEEYYDDDDISWKVRRASTKVLSIAIETRPEFLPLFYKSIAPVLISRFAEREETVKIEIWNTYTTLLRQTAVWAGNTHNGIANVGNSGSSPDSSGAGSRATSPISSLKRKRDTIMEAEDSPIPALCNQAPQVAKAIIKQLSMKKSIPVRQEGFQLLYQLILVLQGGLESNIPSLIPVIEIILKSTDSSGISSSVGGSTTNTKIQVLKFLALFFKTHSLRAIQPYLERLANLITGAIADKSPKIGAQAYVVASELVKLVRPLTAMPTSPSIAAITPPQIRSIFDATIQSLAHSDADQEVREKGILCLGDLLLHTGEEYGQDLQKALFILKERLRNENTRLVTVATISKIAASSTRKDALFGPFLQDIANEILAFLRRNNKPVQAASFACLENILRNSGESLPLITCEHIVKGLQPFISNPDVHLTRSLNSLSTILSTHSNVVATIETDILSSIYQLVGLPIHAVTGPSLDALLLFLSAYVRAGGGALELVDKLSEVAASSNDGIQVPMTASRCIGAIHQISVETDFQSANKIVMNTATLIQSAKTRSSILCLGLLSMGEIGRRTDMREHQDSFKTALKNLTHPSEDVRNASAFAIGNMAAGSPTFFLPSVLAEIEMASKDDRKLHLLLGSVKEVLSHSSSAALVELSNALWSPLFQICESASAQQQVTAADGLSATSAKAGDEARLDSTRNVAAECLGKITLIDPTVYLGQLQSRMQSQSAGTRAAVITAIRFTFSGASPAYDDLLAPLIVHFLSLMTDTDLSVRRLAVSALTSAAHNRPQLIRDHLGQLQPFLYAQAKIDPKLIHEVVMGPFKVKVDEGLNIRKAAYQCMYTLLETCINKLDLSSYLNSVVAGLSDDDDIKVSCYLMLVKLGNYAQPAVTQRLDSAAKPFEDVLKQKLKDSAVKQEVEKLAEMQRAALRTMASLLPLASETMTPRFNSLVDEIKGSALWGADFKEMFANISESKATQNGTEMDID